MIHIVQPCIPHYRIALFKGLLANKNCKFYIDQSITGTIPEQINKKCVDCRIQMLPLGFKWQKNINSITLNQDDVLVICGDIHYLSNIVLSIRAKLSGARVVWWGQVWSAKSSRLSTLLRLFYSKLLSHRFLAYTQIEIKLIPNFLFHRKNLFYTNNALDDTIIKSAIDKHPFKRINSFKEKHDLTNRKVILFCGRITAKVDIKFALDTIKVLSKREPEITFVIIGTGPGDSQLKKYANSIGIKNNIKWVGELVDEDKLAPWFLSSSVFFYPGSIGLSIIHAFNYGLPLVTHCNTTKHMPEIAAFKNKINGECYKENSLESAASALESIISNMKTREQYSKQSKLTVSTEFSMSKMIRSFTDAVSF